MENHRESLSNSLTRNNLYCISEQLIGNNTDDRRPGTQEAPLLLNTLIYMFLAPFGSTAAKRLYDGQVRILKYQTEY